MSFLTGTNTELIYSSIAATAAKATFTSEFHMNPGSSTMGVQYHLPPDFWLPSSHAIGNGIRIVARGIISSTATPTFTFTVRGGAAANVASNPILLGTAALTTISGAANNIWELSGDIVLTAIGAAGGNSTIQGVGRLISSGTANKVDAAYGGAASPGTTATLDTSITNYINFNMTCSASSASNSVTLQQLLVFGLN